MPAKRRKHESPASISGQLREVIATRRLSAQAVATAAGVAPSVVWRFLARERGMTLDTFDGIAAALGLRLVETGRGRGRATPAARGQTAAGAVEAPGVGGPTGAAP